MSPKLPQVYLVASNLAASPLLQSAFQQRHCPLHIEAIEPIGSHFKRYPGDLVH